MANFFIGRPVFAWVIAIIAMLAGAIALMGLPIEQYPDIAPPSITISATYPGASAKSVEDAVTQVIEQQMKGLDHLKYISADSSADGRMSMTLTFESGTDPDIAQVQVQNKLALATPLLPQEVQRRGVVVNKARSGFLMLVGLTTTDGSMSRTDLADYIATNMQDPISRVQGVGTVRIFGSQYAMRIWLNPNALAYYKISPSDVVNAIRAQNTQVTGGELGGNPSVPGQELNATITVRSLMQTPEEFRAISLRTLPDGSQVTVGDVARVEIGSDSYGSNAEFNGTASSGLAIQAAPGANALETARLVRERVEELAQFFPPKMKVVFPYDTTPFVRESIKEVIKTLIEAAFFVSVIMFLFLQNLRATSIVMVTVPVVLLGAIALLYAFGFSINTLTMLAMVLAIGLLVDDAIVVIENVHRIMDEEGLPPLEATRKSMSQITGALIGIGACLSAVFVPMAFFGGTAGVIYRQFSITLVSAMALSVMAAIILTPALCATMLKPHDASADPKPGSLRARLSRPLRMFNAGFASTAKSHDKGVGLLLKRPARFIAIFAALSLATGFGFAHIQQSFLPDEDQGLMLVQAQLPPGATSERTSAVMDQIKKYFREHEADTVRSYFTVTGFSFSGSGQNAGMAFVQLRDWSKRRKPGQSVQAIAGRTMRALSTVRDARIFAFMPPAVPGLGQANGFNFYLTDRGGQGHQALMAARDELLTLANQDPRLVGVRANGLEDEPEFKVNIDYQRAEAMGVSPSDVNTTLGTALGGVYVNDFLDRGRIKRVYVAADAPYRMTPEDLKMWRVPNATGELVPFSSFATTSWTYGSPKLERYNGVPSREIIGSTASGVSSGAAMKAIEEIARKLPQGFGVDWTGISAEERETGARAPALYALSILVVFLCLAALYESWSVPVSVLLVVPLGLMGAVIAAYLGNLSNDIFFQVGLLTTIGLSTKNAILIVEFAKTLEERGRTAFEAAREAARVRLRPIIMTSLAFGLGVLPLVMSAGAGARGRNEIGEAVLGGMLTAAALGLFFTPLFYVLVRRIFAGKKAPAAAASAPAAAE
ncbi:MAG: efflux RND transporter permease subunit [Alphaproteobacteria bacterium]|nr:efflux RND transporter permease subunit [Alphaproteobacteria bacterium]